MTEHFCGEPATPFSDTKNTQQVSIPFHCIKYSQKESGKLSFQLIHLIMMSSVATLSQNSLLPRVLQRLMDARAVFLPGSPNQSLDK